jgi:uncharacterized protein (TIGR00255 family)
MPLRSMTGFAQVKGSAAPSSAAAAKADGALGFTLSLKSVNHRFLDLHLRLPSDTDALEMKLRRLLKEKLARGHVEVTLNVDRGGDEALSLNRQMVAGYVATFRAAAKEFGITGEPDLNALFRMPGAMGASSVAMDDGFEAAVLKTAEDAITRLNEMRAEEGRGIERELRDRMARLLAAIEEVGRLRGAVLRAHLEKLQSRMKELLSAQVDPDRLLQEAALLAERGDIQEEIVRMTNHIDHFLGMLSSGGEVGKKLDFLLQEMNREANTLLSKTSGVVGEALRLTELGLAIKSEVEKLREQVQNLE